MDELALQDDDREEQEAQILGALLNLWNTCTKEREDDVLVLASALGMSKYFKKAA